MSFTIKKCIVVMLTATLQKMHYATLLLQYNVITHNKDRMPSPTCLFMNTLNDARLVNF